MQNAVRTISDQFVFVILLEKERGGELEKSSIFSRDSENRYLKSLSAAIKPNYVQTMKFLSRNSYPCDLKV